MAIIAILELVAGPYKIKLIFNSYVIFNRNIHTKDILHYLINVSLKLHETSQFRRLVCVAPNQRKMVFKRVNNI